MASYFPDLSTMAAENARKRFTSARQPYGDIYAGGQSLYGEGNQGYRNAVNNYADNLKSDPYTDSYSTAQIGKATAGMGHDYDQAGANLSADLAQRGISDSSTMAGGLAGIAAGRAAAMARARNDVALRSVQERQARDQELVGLYGGERQQGLNEMQQGLQGQTGIDQYILNLLTQQQMERQRIKASQDQANQQSLLGLVSAGAGLVPYFL